MWESAEQFGALLEALDAAEIARANELPAAVESPTPPLEKPGPTVLDTLTSIFSDGDSPERRQSLSMSDAPVQQQAVVG